MKLEIKHLAAYLPYGLKVSNNTHPDDVNLVTGLRDETYFTKQNSRYAYGDVENCKPLLRPLSDLTKPININGDCFHPILFLAELAMQNENVKPEIKNSVSFGFDYKIVQKPFGKILKVTRLDEWILIISFNEPERCKHYIFEKLIEWHFDVFGLIDKGLALPLI